MEIKNISYYYFTYGNVFLKMPGNIVSFLEELAGTKAAGEQLGLKTVLNIKV